MTRVQQIPASAMAEVVERFGRGVVEQEQVIVIDPFMGMGGTSLAAEMLACSFIGVDRDAECVAAAEELYHSLRSNPVTTLTPYIPMSI